MSTSGSNVSDIGGETSGSDVYPSAIDIGLGVAGGVSELSVSSA